ncbi:MAG: hypothetical protein LBF34_02050 [Puniceicoccales bacterium]|jgi:hypothetical protein|nr:hypothetical protein [Puniceicoccales bacterium]
MNKLHKKILSIGFGCFTSTVSCSTASNLPSEGLPEAPQGCLRASQSCLRRLWDGLFNCFRLCGNPSNPEESLPAYPEENLPAYQKLSPKFTPKVMPKIRSYQEKLASEGLKVERNPASGFGENLDAYSALLAAQKIDAIAPGTRGNVVITIRYSEVCQFAEYLKRELARRRIFIGAPLDEDHFAVIAPLLGYCIILEFVPPYNSPINACHTSTSNIGAKKKVRISLPYGTKNYQIITPLNVKVYYVNDCPSRQFPLVNFDHTRR